jgi:hypothetical protein
VIAAIADGERSPSLSAALADLEAQTHSERQQIEVLERSAAQPITLPSPDAILRNAIDLERRLALNPAAARDELHRLFKSRAITLELDEDGVYVGRSELMVFTMFKTETPPPVFQEAALPGCGSGGRI